MESPPRRATRRRTILAAGGASLGLVAAAGIWRVTRTPQTATAPWAVDDAPTPVDVRLDALRHAILAPNPHNRQPWTFRLEGDDDVVVGCDLDRRLPATDPFDRHLTIGFGCMIELARIAATARGREVREQTIAALAPCLRELDRHVPATLRAELQPTLEDLWRRLDAARDPAD